MNKNFKWLGIVLAAFVMVACTKGDSDNDSSDPVDAPSTPINVTAVPGNASALVSWIDPDGKGGEGITYTVVSDPDGITATVTGGTAVTVTGLTNGTSYTFTVVAKNSAGTAPASVPSNAVTPSTDPGVPSAPLNVSAVGGTNEATVSWQAPLNAGTSPVTAYVITADNGGPTTVVGVSESPKTITGLAGGITYTFTVAAVNSAGTGPGADSNPVGVIGVPQPPTGVSAVRGDMQATVSWVAPTNTGGVPILSYTVTSNPGNIQATVAGTNAVVSGLTNGTTYTFTVVATNSIGSSAPSTASASVVPAGVPLTPSNVSATRGNGQATISWTVTGNNGSAITLDRIRTYNCSAPNTVIATNTFAPCGSGVCSQAITGLTNDTQQYRFTVQSENAVGASTISAFTDCITPSTTPAELPTAVRNLAASTSGLGPSRVSVAWNAPLDSGENPIVHYRIQVRRYSALVADVTTASTSHTFTTLTPCVYSSGALTGGCNDAYSFYVWAYNGSSADDNNSGGFFSPDNGYGTRAGPVTATPFVGYYDANVPGIFAYIGCPSCHSVALANPLVLNLADTGTEDKRYCNASFGTCPGGNCAACVVNPDLGRRQDIYECPSANGCSIPAMGQTITQGGAEDVLLRAWVQDGNRR